MGEGVGRGSLSVCKQFLLVFSSALASRLFYRMALSDLYPGFEK